jgi:signal transduction histidine kinase
LFEAEGLSSRLLRTIGVVVDITDRKKIVTQAPGMSRKESIEKVSSGIVHEINNSLTAVLGFSELALLMIPIDNKAHRHLTQVIAAGRKARELAQTIRRALNQSTSIPESVSLPSQPGSEPETPPIEVPDAIGPRR